MNQIQRTIPQLAVSLCLMGLLTACGKSSEPAVDATVDADVTTTTDVAGNSAVLPRTESPHGARVFFISPANGATVKNPIKVEFGIQGMIVVKAGDDAANSGHHHLLIDTEVPDKSLPIPADDRHIHFGDGSTQTEITLAPGQHRLQMLLGDHLHIPHDPAVVSKSITITVE